MGAGILNEFRGDLNAELMESMANHERRLQREGLSTEQPKRRSETYDEDEMKKTGLLQVYHNNPIVHHGVKCGVHRDKIIIALVEQNNKLMAIFLEHARTKVPDSVFITTGRQIWDCE